jgi:hypothetical protein
VQHLACVDDIDGAVPERHGFPVCSDHPSRVSIRCADRCGSAQLGVKVWIDCHDPCSSSRERVRGDAVATAEIEHDSAADVVDKVEHCAKFSGKGKGASGLAHIGMPVAVLDELRVLRIVAEPPDGIIRLQHRPHYRVCPGETTANSGNINGMTLRGSAPNVRHNLLANLFGSGWSALLTLAIVPLYLRG